MKNRASSTPMRSCATCRQKREKEGLIRFCPGQEGRLEIDLMEIKPGRGVYLCPDAECIDGAVRNGDLLRGLKGKVKGKETEELSEKILAALKEELQKLLPGVGLDSDTDAADMTASLSRNKKAERAIKLWYIYRSLKDKDNV